MSIDIYKFYLKDSAEGSVVNVKILLWSPEAYLSPDCFAPICW